MDVAYGGLIKCTVEDGNLFHRVGGHVFNSRDEKIAEWFWANFDRDSEFVFARRNAAIHYQKRFVGYPIEQHLYQMDGVDIDKITKELLKIANVDKKTDITELSFYEFLHNNFGSTLCNNYFIPYNTKIWNIDIREMPVSWLAGKLPMPQIDEIFTSNIKRQTETEMVHSAFYYPRKGGSQFIINRLLEGIDVSTNVDCGRIYIDDSLTINGDTFDAAVYTGDVRTISQLIDSDQDVFSVVSKLKSNGTTTVLCTCDVNPYSWIYIPDASVRCHRIIMTGNFSEHNNSPQLASGRTTCTVEFVGAVDTLTIDTALASLPFKPEKVAVNFEPRSYVIQDAGTRDQIAAIKKNLRSSNIWLCGRFAEWEYFNMDAAIASAMKVSDDINAKVPK